MMTLILIHSLIRNNVKMRKVNGDEWESFVQKVTKRE